MVSDYDNVLLLIKLLENSNEGGFKINMQNPDPIKMKMYKNISMKNKVVYQKFYTISANSQKTFAILNKKIDHPHLLAADLTQL